MNLPRILAVEITARCNTHCVMCARRFWGPDIPRGDLSWESYVRCIEVEGLQGVCLGQYGEPLLWPHFVEGAKAAHMRGLYVWTTTNGALLDADLARAVLDSGIDKVIFSVDSFDPEVYARIRPGLKLEEVRDNIELFIKYRDLGNYQTHCAINVTRVVEAPTVTPWDFVDGVALTPEADVSPVPGVIDGESISCERPFEHLTVRADGTVVLCCRDAHMFWRFGNVEDEDPLVIFNNRFFESVRTALDTGKAYPAMCKGCRVFWPDARKPIRNAVR